MTASGVCGVFGQIGWGGASASIKDKGLYKGGRVIITPCSALTDPS